MKTLGLFLLVLVFFSCQSPAINYQVTVVDSLGINPLFPTQLDREGIALLEGYLYAYGNECLPNSHKNKCNILIQLGVDNECNTTYLKELTHWFENDPVMLYKLQNCPAIPANFAIDNSIDKLVLSRHQDTLAVDYLIKGQNNAQEKSWNIDRTDLYRIEDNHFIKIK